MLQEIPEQSIPIIIKGGGGGEDEGYEVSSAIDINANGVFQITEKYDSQPNNWVKSDSDFSVKYVESVVVGEPGAKDVQFCQTSTMKHPLTFAFKDGDGKTIFVVRENKDGENFKLQISVDYADSYFEVSKNSEKEETWSDSVFSKSGAAINLIEVTDREKIAVCQLLKLGTSQIFLNLELL